MPQKKEKIRVLIADDHKMFVDGIASILKDEDEIKVSATCFDGQSVFHKLEKEDIDVILLDINLPEMNGIEVCQKLRDERRDAKVLALTMHNDESFVTEIVNHGAAGYILKNTGRKELVDAIKKVSSGGTYFSDEVTQILMRGLIKQRTNSRRKRQYNAPKISRREKEVLGLIVKEFTTHEIGQHLNISLKTVESHRRSLLTKLDVRNTAGLVRVALDQDLLDRS